MSESYQTDQYLLVHGKAHINDLQQQELLITTLKQLADENKKLLREKQNFEGEMMQRILENKVMKQNFINLLTLAQYENNNWNFGSDNSYVKLTFNEKISKRSYTNFQYLKDFNFYQKIRYSTLMQMIKSNFKDRECHINYENVFDCRPYNGPKTPPTPNSKYKGSHSQNIAAVCRQKNDWRNKLWSLEEMLSYLNRYKQEFKIYSGSDSMKLDGSHVDNLFSKSKPQNSKVQTNDDREFYKELIEKHKKSLELIDNVGVQLQQNLCPMMLTSMQMTPINELKIKCEQDMLIVDVNSIRNQIYTNYSDYLIKNSMVMQCNMREENVNQFNNHMSTTSNEIVTMSSASKAKTVSTDAIGSCKSMTQINNSTLTSEGQTNLEHIITDSVSVFEEGEIVDSADETKKQVPRKKTLKHIKNIKIEKKNRIPFKIDKSKLKSLDRNKLKKSINYQKSSNYYSKLKSTKTESNTANDFRDEEVTKVDDKASSKYTKSYSSHCSNYDRRSRVHDKSSHGTSNYKYEPNIRHQDRYYYRPRRDFADF